MPDFGGTYFLPRLVGEARARALALTGEPVTAEQAQAWGLIWQVVDDERLQAEALTLARRLATGPTSGLGLIKRALNASFANDLDQPARPRARSAARGGPDGGLSRGCGRLRGQAAARVSRRVGMARPRAQDYDAKRGAIREAAAALFAEHGFDGSSMSDLAERCATTKSGPLPLL